MDARDYWKGIKEDEFPLVIGCDERTAHHFNKSESNLSLVCGRVPSNSRQSSPGTPNPYIVEDTVWYALRKNAKAVRHGYRFGAGGKVHFELANFADSNRVSELHFRILLTEFNTWVLIDESAASTRVNEEKLVSERAMQKASKSGITINGNRQVALRPDETNAIEIGSLNFNVYINGDPAEYQPAPKYATMPSLELLELQSRPSLSTAVAHSEADLLLLPEQAEYYILPARAKLRESQTKIQKMVHKGTGAVVVGKRYTELQKQGAQARYRCLRDILGGGHQSNLIPFLSETVIASNYTIIAEYWPQSTTLEELFEDENLSLPSEAAFGFMFAQLLEALRFLAQKNVIHRDIKPAAILIANTQHYPRTSGMVARLSGFSESIVGSRANEIVGHERYRAPEMTGEAYATNVDVYALSKLVRECLSLRKCCHPSDPLSDIVTLGLTQDAAKRPSASQLSETFHKFSSGHYGEPFHFFYVRRRFNFACTDSFDEVDRYVRVADVLDVLDVYTGCDPTVACARLGPFKVAENGNRFDGSYCRLKKAQKIFSKCNIHWACTLISGEREKPWFTKRDPIWCDLSYSMEFRVYYHAPSMMVNISNLLYCTGKVGRSLTQDVSAPALVQEVRGEAAWEGIYVDHESFLKICELLGRDSRLGFSMVNRDLRSIESAALRDRFIEIDSSKYIVLVTNRIVPDIMLLNRKDCSVNMRYVRARDLAGDENVSAEKAIMECDNLGLEDVRAAIQDLMNRPRNLDWKRHWLDEEDIPECSSTSSLSSCSPFSFRLQRFAKGNHKGKRSSQNEIIQSISLDEKDDSGTRGGMNKAEGNLATEDPRADGGTLYAFPRNMEFHKVGPIEKEKSLTDGPHETDYLLSSATTKSSRSPAKDRFDYSFQEMEKAKADESSITPFATERSNRYDEYVETQRSASKRPVERSRLEPYKPWYPPSPPGRNVESWLKNQNAVDASKYSPNKTQRTSDSSEEEEMPKKRRAVAHGTPRKVLNSQESGETDPWNDFRDDEELLNLKMSGDMATLPKPRGTPIKMSQTTRSTRSQAKKARADDSMKEKSGHRVSK